MRAFFVCAGLWNYIKGPSYTILLQRGEKKVGKKSRGKVFESMDKVQVKSARNGITTENQNQSHNTQKEALGPNTKRQG